jgi:ABC-2 type transport system ATP-binding protein
MITTQDLHKHYGMVRALDGLNLFVEPGSIYGFLGPNGAGKTTTLRILTGLAHPTSGTASVDGIDLGADGHLLTRKVGYLPEEPAFYPWMTPFEFLDYLGRLHEIPSKERNRQVRELLDLVHLADVVKRRIGGFSRGMRQRLGLAAAMIHNPKVLLLDEPVSALDPLGRKEILDLIEDLRGHCTVLMSSHILADVERVCNMVGIISKGKMIVQSPRESLMERYARPIFKAEVTDTPAGLRWLEVLKTQPWAVAVSMDADIVHVTVKDVVRARKEILATAVAQDVSLRRFEETRPSLEDVFLQLTVPEVL